MPELPEVETIRRDLQQAVAGCRIKDVEILDPRVLRGISSQDLSKALAGRVVHSIERRGKALVFNISGPRPFLVVQLMMTGQLVVASCPSDAPAKKLSLIFGRQLFVHYNDVRVFGQWRLVRDLGRINYFHVLGPEPLSRGFTPARLAEELSRRHVAVKAFLMDHRRVAGIGNIYASEILFRAGIDPRRRTDELTFDEAAALHSAVREVLKSAVRLRGTTMNDYLDGRGRRGRYMDEIKVYKKDGQPCPVCGTEVERIVQAQRSTFFCPRCQF
ncbi:MAG: bifunctional DNA-formamidopyrimidine glycosylase/DNA-(apurinic or apyrimidinic site) lyase [Candidatus Omnitrophota bacterium]